MSAKETTDTEAKDSTSLSLSKEDHVAIVARAILGAAPIAGPLLAEIATYVIPNQRVERLVKFSEALEQRLTAAEIEIARNHSTTEEFSDLIEEMLRQATRATSQNRIDYLATLASKPLTSKEIDYQEAKHLARILEEINDLEVIWLRFFHYPNEEWRRKHKTVLKHKTASMADPQHKVDGTVIQASYKSHLARLNLLKEETTNYRDGTRAVTGYELAPLGSLLLRSIGLIEQSS